MTEGKFNIGDRVVVNENQGGIYVGYIGTVRGYSKRSNDKKFCYVEIESGMVLIFRDDCLDLVTKNMDEVEEQKINSDGGPSSYYDFPSSWGTFNDFIEHKSEHQWKGFSFHLGNVGKAICRWGDKGGTTIEYDAKKIIYSATRVLKMIVGVEKTREYLQTLLDDKQFKQEK